MAEFPERDEILIATVKKILPYGAFCYLPEYKSDAFLHVSQVSSGWVKNIHEFISEGQRLVVKVHHINTEKNQIDVSLKSVTDDEKRRKLDGIKRGKRGEKLLEVALKNAKYKGKADVKSIIEEEFEDIFACFEECLDNHKALQDLDIPKSVKDQIYELSKSNIKKSQYILSGIITLSCSGVDGVEKIKDVLSIDNKNATCNYLGAPNYKLSLICEDYKKGEKTLSKILSSIEKKAQSNNCSFKFERDDS